MSSFSKYAIRFFHTEWNPKSPLVISSIAVALGPAFDGDAVDRDHQSRFDPRRAGSGRRSAHAADP
jgi:hypothetical protein